MARKGGWLRDSGPRRGLDLVDRRLLLECRRTASLRDRAIARRPRIPRVPGSLLIAAGPGEWRAAWVEGGAAVELYGERGDPPPPGSIPLGRVVRRTPGLDAVLVDIGAERRGFLPVGDAPRDLRLDEGARLLVQVRREARQEKGARLPARINPRPAGPDLQQLAAEAARYEPPRQLDPSPGFAAALALRLPAAPEQIITDDAGVIPEVRRAFSDAEVAHRPAEDWPIHLHTEFAAALAPILEFPGGGKIQIAETPAAVLIDVDTGTPEEDSAERGALAANLAAVQAIARQLRLRQLGGGIVVDFVGMEGRGEREKLRQAMAAALAGDPAEPQVLGWTRLGHLEIVRPRRRRPLSEAMLEPHGLEKKSLALAVESPRLGVRAGGLALAREPPLPVEPPPHRPTFDIARR